jgi:uncharacterized membrane protein
MKNTTEVTAKKKRGILKKTLILIGLIFVFAVMVTFFAGLYSSLVSSGNVGKFLSVMSKIKNVSTLIQLIVLVVLWFFWDDLCLKFFRPEKAVRMRRLKTTTIPMTIILLATVYAL